MIKKLIIIPCAGIIGVSLWGLKYMPVIGLEEAIMTDYMGILEYRKNCGEGCSRTGRVKETLWFGAEGEYEYFDKELKDQYYVSLLHENRLWMVNNFYRNNEFLLSPMNIYGGNSGVTYKLPYTLDDAGNIIVDRDAAYVSRDK